MKLSPFKTMSAIKSGVVSHSRFAKMAERDFKVSPLSLSFVSSFFVNPITPDFFVVTFSQIFPFSSILVIFESVYLLPYFNKNDPIQQIFLS